MKRLWLVCVMVVALAGGAVYATVPDSPSADRYTANGSTTSFPYTFKVLSKMDVEVLVNGVAQTLDVDYTVSGVANPGGGNISFTTNPTNGQTVTILRKQPIQQFSVYTSSAFSPVQIEKDLDRMVMQIQQIREQLSRTLGYPKSSTAIGTVDAPIAGKFARANADGTVSWVTPTNAGALSSPVGISDGGTGATTAAGARSALNAVAETGPTTIQAKGDILGGTADNTWGRLPIGANGSILTADSSTSTGLSWQAAASAAFSAGDIKLTMKTVADSGWVLMNDGTIGSASSGATTRANADTSALYLIIWSNCVDQWCAVVGGRGASATADFAANKPISLPKTYGRALAGYGTGSVAASGLDAAVDITNNTLVVPVNYATWVTGMQVTFSLTSGSISGLTSGLTYYVIRASSGTIRLASTLANAQNGVAVDFTAKSSPVWSVTHIFNPRALGETLGEQTHAMASAELLSHQHSAGRSSASDVSGSSYSGGSFSQGSANTGLTGGNAAMNILDPTVYVNAMIKL